LAKRTIQRYLRAAHPTAPPRGQSWHNFLRNHTVWACDFLQTYDVWFRPIFAFFIIDINTKRVVHVAVTRAPTQAWTAQQVRNATPSGDGPQFLIRDRDEKFGPDFDRAAKRAGIVASTGRKKPRGTAGDRPGLLGRRPAGKIETVTYLDRIVRDPAICAGQPVIRGTRVLVRVVLGYLAHGETTEHILAEFPSLAEEDVRAVIAFAAASAGEDLPAPSPIPPNAQVA
jgi:uncharacterized protein (DUF433 family)